MKLPRLRLPTTRPAAPGPGLEKIRDASRARRRWLFAAVIIAVLAALSGPLGLREGLGRMRTEFVAMRYVQTATEGLMARPVDRARIVTSIDRALELAPTHNVVMQQAGALYMYAGAYPQAVEALKALERGDLSNDISLGHCLLLTGETEEGTALLLAAAGRAQERRFSGRGGDLVYAMTMNNIGYALADGNAELPQAREFLRQAVELAPLQPAYLDSLGWVYYRMGEYRKAAFYLERAVRHGGTRNSAENYYHLGAAYARLGKIRLAARALLKALEYDPQYDEAIAELRRLRYELPQPMPV